MYPGSIPGVASSPSGHQKPANGLSQRGVIGTPLFAGHPVPAKGPGQPANEPTLIRGFRITILRNCYSNGMQRKIAAMQQAAVKYI